MEGNNIFGMHKHHIVFRSQGGLDFAMNLIELTQEEHEGDDGPHKNRVRDLELKKRLQNQLVELFPRAAVSTSIRSVLHWEEREDISKSIFAKCPASGLMAKRFTKARILFVC